MTWAGKLLKVVGIGKNASPTGTVPDIIKNVKDIDWQAEISKGIQKTTDAAVNYGTAALDEAVKKRNAEMNMYQAMGNTNSVPVAVTNLQSKGFLDSLKDIGQNALKGALEGAKDRAIDTVLDRPDVQKLVKESLMDRTNAWIKDNVIVVVLATVAAVFGVMKLTQGGRSSKPKKRY